MIGHKMDQQMVVHSLESYYNTKGRGPAKLKRLSKMKHNEERIKVIYNDRGQPIGDGKKDLASYAGMLVKYNIPVTYKNWAQVPNTMKKNLWNSIQLKFDVDLKTEKKLLSSMAKSWRSFKTQLCRSWIYRLKDKPELLKHPPAKYKKMISQSVWDEFVKIRLSEDFQRTSKLQSERRAKNKHNHRLSRKGYAGLEEELKEEMGPAYKDDRSFLWVKARQNKDGEYGDDATKELAEKVLALKKQVEDGSVVPEENFDVLTMALGPPENSGRFRCQGLGIVPTKNFKSKRYVSELESKLHEEHEKRREVELLLQDLQAQLGELQSKSVSSTSSEKVVSNACKSDSRKYLRSSTNVPGSWGSSKSRTHNLKIKADGQAKTQKQVSKPVSDLGKFKGDRQAKTQKQVSHPISNIGKGEKCRLAIGLKTNIVAEGMFFKKDGPDEIIHNVLYGEHNVRVSITKVFCPNAILPIPVLDEMEIVKDALGSLVTWPKQFVLLDVEEEKNDYGGDAQSGENGALIDSQNGDNGALIDTVIEENDALINIQGSFGSSKIQTRNSKFKGDGKGKTQQVSYPISYKRKGKKGRSAIGSKTNIAAEEVMDVEEEKNDEVDGKAKTRQASRPISNKRKGKKRKLTNILAEEMDAEEAKEANDDGGDRESGENGALIDAQSGQNGALIDTQSGENGALIDAQSGENGALIDAFALTLQTMNAIEIMIPLEKEIFGEENVECYVFKNNLLGFCAMKALDATCIATYMRHLYDKYECSREIVKFFNPASISATSKLGISRLITKRLQNAKGNQICFIPYHIQAKSHWVLIVVDCFSMNVFWLDSSNAKPDEQTKFYINTGLNALLIDGRRKAPNWNIIKCPTQPRNVECGYYVMKFMSELMDDPSLSIETKMRKIADRETYTVDEINEVRVEFMEFVVEHLGD